MLNKFLILLILFAIVQLFAKAQTKLMRTTIHVNGIELHYEKQGKGKPLLLLHGWTQSSAFWQPFIEDYSKKFEVYTIDLRGHGRSSPLAANFSIQKASEDIAQFIEQLKLTQVHAIGFSYGGLVLLELGKSHPALIEKMVLVATTNRYNGKENQKDKPAFTYENLDPSFQTYLKSQHVYGESQIRALFNPDLDYQIDIKPEELKQFRSNVLLVNGDSDEFAGITGAIEMHTYIPQASLWIVPQTGHVAISEENKDEFIKATQTFFAANER
jgi:pimeloyl-ACP methyl ester carboxylesterase